MGHDVKYGRVVTEHGSIPEDEPVIVFRARDALSCPLLSAYHRLCQENGVPAFHQALVEQNYTAFADWQEAHPDLVRTPDSAAHRERLNAWDRSHDDKRRELTFLRDQEIATNEA